MNILTDSTQDVVGVGLLDHNALEQDAQHQGSLANLGSFRNGGGGGTT